MAMVLFTGATACNAPSGPLAGGTGGRSLCRGIYSTRDSEGDLHKWNEYAINGQCFTDSVALTHWQATSELRRKNHVTCTPQPQFSSRSLVADHNYYAYRDGREYLDLDSTTGEYRKVTLAEDVKGRPVFSRLQGCFYERSDAVHGNQILLDSIDIASSQPFDPAEVYTYAISGNDFNAVRFDDSDNGWNAYFCPYLDTEDHYCQSLRNGNELFQPALTAAQQASLLAEAILIRREYNFTAISRSTFDALWIQVETERTEAVREGYHFEVSAIVDTPAFIDQAIFAFIRRASDTMPDQNGNRVPPICYPTRRHIILSNGQSGSISGESCYVNGVYEWSAGS